MISGSALLFQDEFEVEHISQELGKIPDPLNKSYVSAGVLKEE